MLNICATSATPTIHHPRKTSDRRSRRTEIIRPTGANDARAGRSPTGLGRWNDACRLGSQLRQAPPDVGDDGLKVRVRVLPQREELLIIRHCVGDVASVLVQLAQALVTERPEGGSLGWYRRR